MSVRIMQDVWDHSAQSGTALLVLLKLADNANEETRIAWPSVGLLASKCRVSRRTVQRALREIEESGEIELARPATKDKPARYRIGVGGVKMTPLPPERGDTGDQGGDTGDAPGVTPMTPEPEEEPLEPEGCADQASLPLDDERVDQLIAWHGRKVIESGANAPRTTEAERRAARKLLAIADEPRAISRRLDFALSRPFWASKVLKLSDLRKHWPKITVEMRAAEKQAGIRGRDERPDRPAVAGVSYDEDRVVIER